MKTAAVVLATCCAVLVAGCGGGRPAAAPKDKRSRAASGPATAPAVVTRPPAALTQPATSPAGPALLEAGLARIAELERQGEFDRAWKLALETRGAFAGHPQLRDLSRVMGRLRTEKREAAQLAHAARLLDSDAVENWQIAAAELTAGGEVGAILLRKLVRTGPNRAAARAAGILAKLNDAETAALICRRLKAAPADPLRKALLASLRELAGHIPPAALGELYRTAAGADFHKNLQVYRVLAAVFRDAAAGRASEFDRLVGETGAYAKLKAAATTAILSKNRSDADAAAETVADLGVLLRGLRGSYYDGTDFNKLLFERLDGRIDFADRKLPYPDGGQDDRSIRWTGKVQVPITGEYTFHPAADDGVRLWVAGKKLIDQWKTQAVTEFSAKVHLEAGLRAIKMEYYQGQGGCEIHLRFEGPGIDKQLITSRYLVTAPWKAAGPGDDSGGK